MIRRLRLAWIAAVVCLFGAVAYAQDASAPVPAPPPVVDSQAILSALQGHRYALLAALLLYLVAGGVKQGWLGTWLQGHLPKRALPWLVPATSLVFLSTTEVITGKAWQAALLDGLLAGILPVVGHEMVVESVLNGRELIPARAAPAAPLPRNTRTSAPPGPGGGGAALAFGLLVAVCFQRVLTACTPQARQDAKTVLDWVLSGTQLACAQASELTSSTEVAQACNIDMQVSPGVQSFLDQLLAQKAAAKRSGFQWHPIAPPATPAPDAGSSYEGPRPLLAPGVRAPRLLPA